MSDNEKMLYLNTPITTKANDIIGLSVYAERLSDAIDEGAQMIAITSPFGSGKTSVIDLLQENRANNKNEYILKVPMWSQLHHMENKTNELHINFLYQISSLINHKRGTYISRRLSNNYGLLTLHASKNRSWLFATVSILFGCLSWGINHFSEKVENFFPLFKDRTEYISIALAILAVYIGVFVLTKAEIIFSSKKSEKERTIEEDEIIDIYRTEILKYSTCIGERIRYLTKNKFKPFAKHNYIIVVEDLDRTNDGKSVIEFLTELRKYYLPANYSKSKNSIFKNNVVFIVNIKSESVLLSEIVAKESSNSNSTVISADDLSEESDDSNNTNWFLKENTGEFLFAKIFDYVLDLQTINIVDYETVLEGLLKSKKDILAKFELTIPDDNLIKIPGMLWIIRGRTLDIREIKNRLNKLFLIYETLQNRFPTEKNQISFEKCAIVAYLTTAFEFEFHLTDDIAFQKLIELKIKGLLKIENCKEILNTKNDEYAKAVLELVESKLIDNSYRMYFYNYPKDSRIYSYSETIVQKSILYGDDFEDLESAIDNVIGCNSDIIVDSFEKLTQLKLKLPPVVYLYEKLYIQALCKEENEIISWMDSLDKSVSSVDKNISEILRILKFDPHRKQYNVEHAKRFCESWEKVFSEDGLIKLRGLLCENFSDEIIWYKSLFFGVHNVIRTTEMDNLSIINCINLLNIQNDEFGLDEVEYIIERFCEINNPSTLEIDKAKSFLKIVESIIDLFEISKIYIKFMKKINTISPEFESVVVGYINMDPDNENVDFSSQKIIFKGYQELINQVDCKLLTSQTLTNISSIHQFGGYERYSDEVASFLLLHKFYFAYVIINLLKDHSFDLSDINIYSIIKEQINWLYSNRELFVKLRTYVIQNATNIISDFSFLFSEEFDIVSESEFNLIKNRDDISEDNILELIPARLVTEVEADFISKYYCRKIQNNNTAFVFLKYIANMSIEIAKYCFESLDYSHAIQYYRFANAKKTIVKNVFSNILDLDTCEGRLKYMEVTKCLDSGFENAIAEELVNDKNLQDYYISIVNSSTKTFTSIKSQTLKILYSFGRIYPMNDIVTERYFKDKKYINYVVSKTNYHKQFVIDLGERLEVLWPVYIEIFSQGKYPNTCTYMSNNLQFLNKIIERKDYEGFSEKVRMILTKVYQDSDSIENVLEYGNKFAIKYFSSINGFTDYDAAKTFIDVVESNSQLLASEEIYANTYEKLWNSTLKSRYTKLRKKNGLK